MPCNSAKLAQAFVDAGVPHVIAINAEDEILDEAARCFSRQLYQTLFNQDSIADSFLKSRIAVKLDDGLRKHFHKTTLQRGVNFDEAFKFALLPPVPHNVGLTFELSNSHNLIYPQWEKTNIPREDHHFVGRKKDIYQVIKELVESKSSCIALHGMGGIGKTALAYAIGRWLHERDRYRDGVWWFSLRDTNSVETLIAKINQELELNSFSLEKKLKNDRLFLILDDLDELVKNENEKEQLIKLLNSLIQQCPHLRLLLTARTTLSVDLVSCYQQEVRSMEVEETKAIFKEYAPPQDQWGNEDLHQDFQRLATFLDGYPLAIRLAGSYMKKKQCTLKMLCDDLKIAPLKVLESRPNSTDSLKITLELSFQILSVPAQDLFPLLAFFPSGLTKELAMAIWGEDGYEVLGELLEFSMAERYLVFTDWRVNLPEPARTYAESKLQKARGLNYYAPKVLSFYQTQFCEKVSQLFENGKIEQGQKLLLQENSNLILFLKWGYDHETNPEKICHSARITASLSRDWRWIEPNQDPLERLDLAGKAAQKNQDLDGIDLVNQAIFDLKSQGLFKNIQELQQQEEEGESFRFEIITINSRGEEIRREEKQAQYYREDLEDDVFINMVNIPEGEYWMGTPDAEIERLNQKYDTSIFDLESPQHQVRLSAFSMSQTPITQAQWKAIATRTDLKVNLDLNIAPSHFKGKDRPVECVSWEEAVEFCQRLSKLTKKAYQLPSEAQWEYACRGIRVENITAKEWNENYHQLFHFGETITSDLANYRGDYTFVDEPTGEYRAETTPVGQFPPNAFGLYNMHGNVWEWCEDDFVESYQNTPRNGSPHSDKNAKSIVVRGGSWDSTPNGCRSGFRNNHFYRASLFNHLGFRVMCAVGRDQ